MPGDHPEYDGRVKYSLHSFASIYLFLFFTYYKYELLIFTLNSSISNDSYQL